MISHTSLPNALALVACAINFTYCNNDPPEPQNVLLVREDWASDVRQGLNDLERMVHDVVVGNGGGPSFPPLR